MHEMSVVRDIVAMVCDACRGYRDAHVRQVHLTVGAMHDVETDLVPGLFRFLAKGTPAQDAELSIKVVPVTLRCGVCGEIFPYDIWHRGVATCPQCGATRCHAIYSGKEFFLDSIEVEKASAVA